MGGKYCCGGIVTIVMLALKKRLGFVSDEIAKEYISIAF